MFCERNQRSSGRTLEVIYMLGNKDFGLDTIKHYGVLTYIDGEDIIHEEKVKSVNGDYGRVYDDIYEAIINGKDNTITDEQTLMQMEMLENGVNNLK